jgi:hypothetical protein
MKRPVQRHARFDELLARMSDRRWRLDNLYTITDKHGQERRFGLNAPQARLLTGMHYLNIVLKARQLGFSTLIDMLALDCAIFNSNFAAGIVADTLDNAKGLLERVKFSYERMPKAIRAQIGIKTDNTEELEFSNGSAIRVGTSLRSGTYNLLHISEYGKICAKFPDKAREIKSGALNTVAPKQLVFIESTAEGKSGDFFDKCAEAERQAISGKPLGAMDYKFHFFPWFDDTAYRLAADAPYSEEMRTYFSDLKAQGIALTPEQRAWYAAKAKEQGDDMYKEFPSTPAEAFKAVRDGAYFARDMLNLRERKKIGAFEPVAGTPVNTFWDLGLGDYMSIWLHQQVAGRHRFVGFIEGSGEGLAHYFDIMDKWRVRRGAKWGRHYGPHDIDNRQDDSAGRVTTRLAIAKGLGFDFIKVERTADKRNSIQAARTKLPECEFDEQGCAKGIEHLENYSRDWDDRLGVWRSQPRHDEHSHGADAFMTFADGYAPERVSSYDWKKYQVGAAV